METVCVICFLTDVDRMHKKVSGLLWLTAVVLHCVYIYIQVDAGSIIKYKNRSHVEFKC